MCNVDQEQACPLHQLHKLKTFRGFFCAESVARQVFVFGCSLISRKARLVSAKSARWQHCRQFFKLQPASSDFLKHTVCVSLYIYVICLWKRSVFLFIHKIIPLKVSVECWEQIFTVSDIASDDLGSSWTRESFEFCNHRTILHRSQCRSRISSRPPWRARPSRASCVAPRTAPRRRSLTRNRRASFSGSILLDG